MWSLWSRQISQPKGCGNGLLCTVSFLATSSLAEVGWADGSQNLVFRMKAVRKWQSRRLFPLGWERQVGTWDSPVQTRERFSSSRDKATEHRTCRTKWTRMLSSGIAAKLGVFLWISHYITGAALHTHTCCIHFSVWSYKYLQVRYWRDTHAEAWIWSSTSVLAAWFTQWTSAVSGSYFHLLYTLQN